MQHDTTTGLVHNVDERKKLITQIVKQYPGDGRNGKLKTDWHKAFLEHPEWATALGASNPLRLQRVHAMGSYIRGKLRVFATGAIEEPKPKRKYTRKQKRVVAKPETNGHTLPVQEPPDLIHNCPHCGYNILMHHTAYAIAKRHSPFAK